MLGEKIKSKFGKSLGNSILFLDRIGITPLMLTYLAIISALVAAYLFYKGHILLGAVFVFANYFLDAIDGLLARKTNQSSRLGFILDNVSDHVFRKTWFFVFAIKGYTSFTLITIALFGYYISLLLFYLPKINKNVKMLHNIPLVNLFLFFGLLVSIKIPFAFESMIILQFVLFLIHLVGIIYLNRNN